MHKVFGWLQENEKTLVCVSDNIDLSNWFGPDGRQRHRRVAEGSLRQYGNGPRGSEEAPGDRSVGGSKPYYGYKSQKRKDGDGHGWSPDEHASQVLMSIIDKVLAGRSTESIAKELNTAGELPPSDYIRHRAGKPTKGTKWSNATIRQLLKSETLLGYATHNGKTLRDEDGLPIRKAPELISREKFDRLQTALGARSFKVSNRSENVSPMLGVSPFAPYARSRCTFGSITARPGARLIAITNAQAAQHQAGRNCCPNMGRTSPKLTRSRSSRNSSFCGGTAMSRSRSRITSPGDNHEEQLADAKRAAQEIALMLGSATSDTMRKFYQNQLEAIDRRMAALRNCRCPKVVGRLEASTDLR